MRRSLLPCLFALSLLGVLTARPAAAQPGAPADDPAAQDSPALIAAYDEAFAALVAGAYQRAAAAFDDIAGQSVDPERRAAARELARLARALLERGVTGPGPAPATRAELAARAERGGRIQFVSATTIASFYSGFVLLDLLDIEEFQAGVLVVTGATGAGFAISLLASRGRSISEGMAGSYGVGLALGAANGLLLAAPIGLEDSEGVLGLGLAGLVAGGAGGLLLADRVRPTPAQATMTGLLGITGIATVGLGLAIIQPDSLDGDSALLALAGGLDAGAAAGLVLAPSIDWSESRANLVGLSTFVGALGGAAVAAIAVGEPETDGDGRLYGSLVLGGLWTGLGLATHLTRDMPPDPRFGAPTDAPAAPTGPPPTARVIVPVVREGGGGLAVAGTF